MSEIERAIEQGEWRLQLINAMRPNGAGGVGMVQCTEIWRQNDEEQFIESALTVLRAELEREKNEPLTWDELKAMEGKAVYIKMLVDSPKYPSCWSIIGESYNHGDSEHVVILDAYDSESGCLEKYGVSWIAYRYEPEGEPNV